jgi:hypothetical protein
MSACCEQKTVWEISIKFGSMGTHISGANVITVPVTLLHRYHKITQRRIIITINDLRNGLSQRQNNTECSAKCSTHTAKGFISRARCLSVTCGSSLWRAWPSLLFAFSYSGIRYGPEELETGIFSCRCLKDCVQLVEPGPRAAPDSPVGARRPSDWSYHSYRVARQRVQNFLNLKNCACFSSPWIVIY